ncbi:hypothetical protein V6N12_058309 [Hibiscus sabdariffa]|uniref:CCT domain-containing protein n=1 Tax=Hibiscus sabdariffa TaxID=183260 RepID=A0ABR2ES75_9ROSI
MQAKNLDKMNYRSFLRSPKKEEQYVPDSVIELDDPKESCTNGDGDIMDELEGILGIENEENIPANEKIHDHLSWDLMDWEIRFQSEEEIDEDEVDNHRQVAAVKTGNMGFWEGVEKKDSLNLNLNYEHVLDAWSDRGPILADDYPISMASNGYYMGEVPVMEPEERRRREASVLRYKEKRRNRLFSKKIRYQVRKLNADKRPRLKGRFVKRVS